MTALPTRTVRVLLVDDDPRVRSGLQRLLATAPAIDLAGSAATPEQARRVLDTSDVDVVLVDLGPGGLGTGLAMIRELSAERPVVVLGIDGAARGRALAAGAATYVEKDGEPDVLLAVLHADAAGADPSPAVSPDDVVARTSGNVALAVLLLATFAGPWLVWSSTIAQARRLIGWHLPLGVALWTLTPSLLVATLAVGGRPALRDLGARLTRWRVPGRAYALALGFPLVIGTVAVGLTGLLGGHVQLGAALPVGAALAYLAYGTGLFLLTEEAAWRGLLLPRLQARVRPAPAALLLGVVWGLWHLPLLHVPGESDQGLPLAGLLVLTTATSVVMSALVGLARGSVLVAALFHAALDATYAFTGVVGGDRITFWVVVALTVAAAVAAVRMKVPSVRATAQSLPS